ncbi:MAG: hypothetical protein V3U88_10020, partial [Methylococcales bacterium]
MKTNNNPAPVVEVIPCTFKLNNDGAGFLFLTKPSQEAHRCSTQRLRAFGQEQKNTSQNVQVVSCTFVD